MSHYYSVLLCTRHYAGGWRSNNNPNSEAPSEVTVPHDMCPLDMKNGKLGEKTELGASHKRSEQSWYMAKQGQPSGTRQWVFLPCHGCVASALGMEGTYYTFLEGMTAKHSPQRIPRGWQHHLGNCCDKKHTALAPRGLGGLCHFHGGCFCSQGGAGAGRTLHTWISALRITHLNGCFTCSLRWCHLTQPS